MSILSKSSERHADRTLVGHEPGVRVHFLDVLLQGKLVENLSAILADHLCVFLLPMTFQGLFGEERL